MNTFEGSHFGSYKTYFIIGFVKREEHFLNNSISVNKGFKTPFYLKLHFSEKNTKIQVRILGIFKPLLQCVPTSFVYQFTKKKSSKKRESLFTF